MKWTNPGHQLDELGARYLNVRNIYLYGVDEKARDAYEFIQWLGVADEFNISFVLDITVLNREGAVKEFCGRPVIAFQTDLCDAVRLDPKACAVALPWIAQTNERSALEQAGAVNIFYLIESFNSQENFIQNFLCVWLMYKHGKLLSHWTDYNVTLRWNQNCKYCLNFNEYLENPQDVTFEEFKAHIDMMFSKFDYIYSLHLCGGEPQLARQLPEMICYLKENYGDRIFHLFIITNGTIVPRDELVDAMKAINGHFFIDDYSDTISNTRIGEITAKLDAAGIGYQMLKADAWYDLDHENADNSALSAAELEAWKDSCNSYLQTFNHGRIYACCYQEYAHLAGIGELDPENDYLDIATASKMEILEFRQGYTKKGYVDFCKRCRGVGEHAKKVAPAVQIPRNAPRAVPGKVAEDRGLVSVCVPIYNTEKYLNRCIKSLTAQSYPNLEIVLVDDGSTDNSGLICDTYAATDPRIVVVHKPNGGEASARNAALQKATGKYIMFIDSDDEYLPTAVQTLVEEMTSDQVGLVIGGYLERSGDVEHFATGHMRSYTTQEIARAYLAGECLYAMPYIASTVNGKLFRRDIIAVNDLQFDERFVIGNDSVFMCAYLKYAHTIRDVLAPIYIYYKYKPSERVQGMNWYYPDGFFAFAYIADRMIKLIQPDEAEFKQLVIKQYKDFFYAAVNAAANLDRFKDGLLPYFTDFSHEIDLLQVGAELDLAENYITKEPGALPLRLLSYLFVNKRFDVLCKLLESLSKTRRVIPFCGERSRQMIQLEKQPPKKATDTEEEANSASEYNKYLSVPSSFADDEELMDQIYELAVDVIKCQQENGDFRAKICQLESSVAEANNKTIQADKRVVEEKQRADEEKRRADMAEANDELHKAMIAEYINSTSWRITKPLREIMKRLRGLHDA